MNNTLFRLKLPANLSVFQALKVGEFIVNQDLIFVCRVYIFIANLVEVFVGVS